MRCRAYPTLLVVSTPIPLEVDFTAQPMADDAMNLPIDERLGGLSVGHTAQDARTSYQADTALFIPAARELRH